MMLPYKPDPELLPMHRPRCPHCEARMITVAIDSGDGVEQRRLECRKCAYTEIATLPSHPFPSSDGDPPAGGQRTPDKQQHF